MSRELEIWQFIGDRLKRGERVVLLVVAESHGSSPGRAGYKMVVAGDGELIGSIGGGVMEVNLVEQSRDLLLEPADSSFRTAIKDQEHRKNSERASGMICSGGQVVILAEIRPSELDEIEVILEDLRKNRRPSLWLDERGLSAAPRRIDEQNYPLPFFERIDDRFNFHDKLGPRDGLTIVGGGHCALALSELMAKLNFRVSIYDDRPSLNTIAKNHFADHVHILESYEEISSNMTDDDAYVVVMTLGYKSDAAVIRKLLGRPFKYFGVLGSKAKMATLLRELKNEGLPQEQLDAIRTPIGIPINSRTPEEIAVSIAAEIISVKNA